MKREFPRRLSIACPSPRRFGVTRMEIIAVVWILGLTAWLLVPAISKNRIAAARSQCLNNLSQLGQALSKYMTEHDERWPYVAKLRSVKLGGGSDKWPTLPTVLDGYVPADSPLYRCPSDSRRLAADDSLASGSAGGDTYYETEGLSYEWWWGDARGGRKIGQESISSAKGFGFGRADQRVLADFEPFHEGDGGGAINSLFADFKARSSPARQ